MQEQFRSLINLLDYIPSYNSSICYSQFDNILAKYIYILNYINSYNEDYKRSTNVYYSDISDIRDNIQRALYDNSSDTKIAAFERASNELKTDILALANLIKPREEAIIEVA